MISINNILMDKIKLLPHKSGCYLFKDSLDKVIYIGKSKNLNKRVNNYFINNKKNEKTAKLVSKIFDLDFIITNNETEAIILEKSLIKKYKPHYNILLREGGDELYLILTKEKYPRLFCSRNPKKYNCNYYGPINSDIYTKKQLLSFLNSYYKLVWCKKIGKTSCFYYDMGLCLAPCINDVDQQFYIDAFNKIDKLLSGNSSELQNELELLKNNAAKDLKFELASQYKNIQETLEKIIQNNKLLFFNKKTFDIFVFYKNNDTITMVIFSYFDGKLISKYQDTIFMFHDNELDYIKSFLYSYYSNNTKKIKIYTSIKIEDLNDLEKIINCHFINPNSKLIKNIFLNAIENAQHINKNNYHKLIKNLNGPEECINKLKKILNLSNLSLIEIYDNSNLYGTNVVGAKLAYLNGHKIKKLSRKFNIKGNVNSDVYYMKEVIYRRFLNFKKENILPNLIIVDGGIHQINAAISSLKMHNLDNIINVIGLKKDTKHKTKSIVISNKKEIILDKKDDLYIFLSNMQDEVHNFAINFFKNKKNNSLFSNELLNIQGVGRESLKKILIRYNSLEEIKIASIEELSQIVSKKTANNIKDYFKNK